MGQVEFFRPVATQWQQKGRRRWRWDCLWPGNPVVPKEARTGVARREGREQADVEIVCAFPTQEIHGHTRVSIHKAQRSR